MGAIFLDDQNYSAPSVEVDTELSDTSENPIANKAVKKAIDNIDIDDSELLHKDGSVVAYNLTIGTRLEKSTIGGLSFGQGNQVAASGDCSHAEGAHTNASGQYAHAEGAGTTASGQAAHSEGQSTQATEAAAHAEGIQSVAEGSGAHAEGLHTTAKAPFAHSEGQNTEASSMAAHAEGSNTIASGQFSHAEGYGGKAYKNWSHAEGYSTKANSEYSHAEGNSTTASGQYSHTEGYQTETSGEASHAEGYYTKASGTAAHSEGYHTTASELYSHAEGYYTEAKYSEQHVSGKYNDNKGNTLFEIGNGESDTARSNAFEVYRDGHINVNGDIYQNGSKLDILSGDTKGQPNGLASLDVSGKVPSNQLPSYVDDVIEGYYNSETDKFYEDPEGTTEIAAETGKIYLDVGTNKTYRWSGTTFIQVGGSDIDEAAFLHKDGSVIADYLTIGSRKAGSVIGGNSLASGLNTTASELYSHAEGRSSLATGAGSHAEGERSEASGQCSHAEGYSTSATANYSHAEGSSTIARGLNSHAEGQNTYANQPYQHVSGIYNKNKEDTLFEIGNGTAYNKRNNAFEVYKDGHINVNGDIYQNGEKVDLSSMQVSELPTASSDVAGKIYQYAGETTTDYTNGYFYTCIEDPDDAGNYIWKNAEVQSGGVPEGVLLKDGSVPADKLEIGEGSKTNYDDGSLANGYGAEARGRQSHAEGSETRAIGQGSHSEGNSTFAEGHFSHAEGVNTTASGTSSHAEGVHNTASGTYSHAEGAYNTASRNSQHVSGMYNNNKEDTLFEIGNGTGTNARSNAFEVTNDGFIRTHNNTTKIAFGVDENGNYGYIKDGADTVTPFKSGSDGLSLKYLETYGGPDSAAETNPSESFNINLVKGKKYLLVCSIRQTSGTAQNSYSTGGFKTVTSSSSDVTITDAISDYQSRKSYFGIKILETTNTGVKNITITADEASIYKLAVICAVFEIL